MFYLEDIKYKEIISIDQLTISANRVTCIVGESGSGKTTFLKLLNNLITADSGRISYKNCPLKKIDPIELRRKVVMLPQTPVIFPETIKDNLLIGLKFSEKPIVVDDDQLEEIVNLLQLPKELTDLAKDLSGGEKQRLALGRILLMKPEAMLLDEPSAALDEATEEKVIKKLVSYAKNQRITLIMVTHSKKIAKDYATDIIELKEGKIINQRRRDHGSSN